MHIENTNHQQTQELSWSEQKLKTPAINPVAFLNNHSQATSQISDNSLILSKKLDDAVKPKNLSG